MNGWLDWRAVELQGDWGLREKSDAMGEEWDKGAQMWDARWKNDLEFTRRQADALDLLPTDTVLDVGCGTGPLTMFVAPRVRKVVATDYGRGMLARLEENACERGLGNVQTLQGNWYAMEPGRDLPVCDVAVTRWSPAQGDILKFSRCATRRCYSLSSVTPDFAENGHVEGTFWCRSTVDEGLNTSPRPCGRKYGFNVHFNLLYDHGANPTVTYVADERTVVGTTPEEVRRKVFGVPPQGGPATGAPRRQPPGEVPSWHRDIVRNDDGTWTFHYRHVMAILGWDPHELRY